MAIEFKRIYDDGDTVTITADKDCDMGELLDTFKRFALACGYHPETVAEYLEDDFK